VEYFVLIVEDNDLLQRAAQRTCARLFANAGHTTVITIAADGHEARKAIMAKKFDYVLSDIEFPHGNSVEVHDLVGQASPQALFVANTGNPNHADVTTLKERGVTVLYKPYGPQALAAAFGLT
jgi:DNA-binding NarL/FixJ family response regulator